MKKILILTLFAVLSFNHINAQTRKETSGWFMFLNGTKFNEKWGLHFDAQFRSGDEFDFLKNVLIRPGLTYYINKKSNVTVGYLLNQTYLKGVVDLSSGAQIKNPLNEHRIWEQYIINHKIRSVFAAHRFRLEQRFIPNNNADDVFAQRLRYFFRLVQPFQKKQDSFTEGAFIALQNETFFNVQNNQNVNGSFFDQNRAYLATGYRFSKKMDVELGYLNQFVNGRVNNTVNNVVQVAVYSRF